MTTPTLPPCPVCICGAPLVLPDRAGYCCSVQSCGMFDPDAELSRGDWRHINAIVARKVAEAVEAERPKWQRAHTLWAENVAAERDAAHAAIREWSSAVDMFQRSFTVETSSRLLAAEDALRALLPPVAAPIGEEAGE